MTLVEYEHWLPPSVWLNSSNAKVGTKLYAVPPLVFSLEDDDWEDFLEEG